MTGLWRHKNVLNPFQFGAFAFQVFSHKLMRWLAPWFFIGAFITNTMIASFNSFYALIFAAQCVFYGTAFIAHFLPHLREKSAIKLVYFFVQVNIALIDAALKFITGHRMTTWKPSAR